MAVHLFTEHALASTLGALSVASVLCHIGDEAMIETHSASLPGIEGAVGIEVSSPDVQTQLFDGFEGRLLMSFEVEGVIVISGH